MAQLLVQKPSIGRVHEYFDRNTLFFLACRWQTMKQKPNDTADRVFAAIPYLRLVQSPLKPRGCGSTS